METETEPVLNETELLRMLQFVTEHPERHNQGIWFEVPLNPKEVLASEGTEWHCQTTGCLAGWTGLLNGWRPHVVDDHGVQFWAGAVMVKVDDPDQVDVARDVARRILGLTEDRATALFSFTDTLAELWQIASQITDGRIQPPRHIAAEIERTGTEYHVE